jgi:hypothetical protein
MDDNSLFQASPNMPSELSGSVPRRIRLSESSRLLPFVLASLIGVTIITGFLYYKHVVHQIQQRSVLRQDGVEVQGEITSLRTC